MPVLYIIGAGCSRNFNECTSRVPELKPPLNADFFKMAKKIIDFYELTNMFSAISGLDHFTRHLNRMYGYGDSESDTRVYDDDRLDLERVMTHFYLEHELLEFSQSPVRLITGSSRVKTLNELLAYTITESLRGPICQKHISLAKKMQKGDIVWNFNYDLLMDNALYSQDKFSDSGYVMRFDYTFAGQGWERFKDVPSDVKILKLHGSLNWLACTTCGCNLLLPRRKFIPQMWKEIRHPPLLRACPNCTPSTRMLSLKRIIIPPSLVKSFGEKEVSYLWKYASSLSDFNRIVVIGFRFAEQDAELEMLLRTMFKNGRIPLDNPIHIVNPRPKRVIGRFKSIFTRSKITHESPSSYFSSLL